MVVYRPNSANKLHKIPMLKLSDQMFGCLTILMATDIDLKTNYLFTDVWTKNDKLSLERILVFMTLSMAMAML